MRVITHALTLRPWWAAAIVAGAKRIENRGRRLPVRWTDKLVALHAGRRQMVAEDRPTLSLFASELRDLGIVSGTCVERSIVALVRFTECRGPADNAGPWSVQGEYGWVIGEVVPIEPVSAAIGALGFWPLDEWTAERVNAAFVAALPNPHPSHIETVMPDPMRIGGVDVPRIALLAGENVMRGGACFRRSAVAEAIQKAWREAEGLLDYGRSERAAEALIDRHKRAGLIVKGPVASRRDWRWAGETAGEVAR